MLTATVLVLFMTLPGLALFYGGLVRSKNVLSVLMHCFAIACLASVLWVAGLYTMAFSDGGAWLGDFKHLFLKGITADELNGGTFPETIFVMFQMTFAIITPGLIVGAFVERMKFTAVLLFTALWLILVYAPVFGFRFHFRFWFLFHFRFGGLFRFDFGRPLPASAGQCRPVPTVCAGGLFGQQCPIS